MSTANNGSAMVEVRKKIILSNYLLKNFSLVTS